MSNLIHSTRKRLGLTGAELANRLGCTAGAVSQLERSERDGTIRLDTLNRALGALGHHATIAAVAEHPRSRYTPDRVTEAINAALDAAEGPSALRTLTRAAQEVREHGDLFDPDELSTRNSLIRDRRWEMLFRAVYGGSLPTGVQPDWAKPERLPRPWYVSEFEPLRRRARTSTPPQLRALNILLDQRSLTRA